MMREIKLLYATLCWQHKLTYSALLLYVVGMLLSWRVGIVALALLLVASLVKNISLRQWGSHGLQGWQRVPLLLMVLFWLVYAASAFYSTNSAQGWQEAATKLPFLLIPLMLLGGSTAYLTRRHIKALFYLMIAVILLRFVVCIGIDVVGYLAGKPFAELRDWQFDPLGLHHNYLALYIVVSIGFIYTEVVKHWKERSICWRWSMLASAVLLLCYLVISDSRSGEVAVAFLAIACFVHLAFFRNRLKLALAAAGVAILLTVGAYLAMPQMFARMTHAVAEMAAGRSGDDRPKLLHCGLQAAQGHWVFGYGSGDYMPPLLQSYKDYGWMKGYNHGYGTHNQYMETILQSGLIGLSAMLAMLLAPIAVSWRKRKAMLLTTLMTLSVLIMICFESMFNRQMGVQFVPALLSALLLYMPDNKMLLK